MKYNSIAAATVLGAVLFTSCQKETASGPSPVAPAATSTGHAKASGICYAIATDERGSVLALLDQGTGGMTSVARITDPAGVVVDHFTGIAWDVDNQCTWLVTPKNVTNADHGCRLWRIDGALPTSGFSVLVAEPVAILHDAMGTVTDAKDLTYFGHKLHVLRFPNTAAGGPSKLGTLTLDGLVCTVSDAGMPNVQAITEDCQGRLQALDLTAAQPQLYELDANGNVLTGPVDFGTTDFHAPDGGLAASIGCGSDELFGVNVSSMMATSLNSSMPALAHLPATYDMMEVQ